jgi:hypothetical protein
MVLVFMIFLTFSFFSEEQYALRGLKPDSSRVALVVGNSKYKFPINELKYAEIDAQRIAAALDDLGFKLIFVPNATKEVLFDKIREWEIELKSARVAMFYYVGHGMQLAGVNYLIPVDANIKVENEIKFESVDASIVLVKMKEAKCETNIVVLDACRDKPFEFNTHYTGFAEVKELPENSIVVYSTRAGAPATDINSFSTFFCSHLKEEPYLEIKDFLQSVTKHVSDNTGGKQLPLPMGTLDHDFYFSEDPNIVIDPPPPPPGDDDKKNRKVKLISTPYKYRKNFVKGMIIKRRGFFERTWHPIKYFKNQFEGMKIKKKKIILIIDRRTDLMWHQSESKPMTHKEAEKWINELNYNGYAGFYNWRLPSIDEAASLLEDSGDPKDDVLYINGIFSTHQKRIWTCDKAFKDSEDNFNESIKLYWTVDFKKGIVARFSGESSISVRPVRSID